MTELLSNLAYSLVGLLVGYALGYTTREVHEIKEAVCPDEHSGHNHPAHEKKKQGNSMSKSVMQSRLVGGLLVALALITVIISTVVAYEDKQQAECFTRYNLAFGKAYTARAKAADADRQSLNRMLLSVGDQTLDQQGRRAAFAKYLEEIRQTDAQRAKNPLPQPPNPERYCD